MVFHFRKKSYEREFSENIEMNEISNALHSRYAGYVQRASENCVIFLLFEFHHWVTSAPIIITKSKQRKRNMKMHVHAMPSRNYATVHFAGSKQYNIHFYCVRSRKNTKPFRVAGACCFVHSLISLSSFVYRFELVSIHLKQNKNMFEVTMTLNWIIIFRSIFINQLMMWWEITEIDHEIANPSFIDTLCRSNYIKQPKNNRKKENYMERRTLYGKRSSHFTYTSFINRHWQVRSVSS